MAPNADGLNAGDAFCISIEAMAASLSRLKVDKRKTQYFSGAHYHSMTQGKIKCRYLTIKNRILLEIYYLLGDLEAQINDFVCHYDHQRYHENIGNLTPADVYFGRGQTILLERERIKRQTIQNRRLINRGNAG